MGQVQHWIEKGKMQGSVIEFILLLYNNSNSLCSNKGCLCVVIINYVVKLRLSVIHALLVERYYILYYILS
jgi:hypothetical protein